MRHASVLALLAASILLVPPAARAGDCQVEAGPDDRVSRGEPLVIHAGEKVENAIALHGDLTLEPGAEVETAVAVGGNVTVRSGARVRQDAVAIAGDLVVEPEARVGKDAVSLGGRVQDRKGSHIEGSVVGLSIQGGKSSLARQILKGVSALDGCVVSTKRGTGG